MYSKGISWIDDCRIPFESGIVLGKKLPIQTGGTIYGGGKGFHRTTELEEYKDGGRFPANILVCDDMLNDGVVSKGGTGKKYPPQYEDKLHGLGVRKTLQVSSFNDKGTNSRYYDIDKWFDNIISE
jgi:hypothetical protein